jgi:hypothetical protein
LPNLTLMPHQVKGVDELANGKILIGGVGTGKTITALAYYFTKVCGGVIGDIYSMRHPIDIIVITTAKKRDDLDWDKDALKFGIGRDPALNPSSINYTVDSWNNIGKYTHIHNAFFIFDEQRVVGSGAWSKAFIHIAKSNQWILLSATPGDTWMDYVPVFIANGFVKNITEFKREHVVYNTFSKYPKIERFTKVGTLVRWRAKILVEMPYERHTVRHLVDVEVPYDEELMRRVMIDRWHVFEHRPLRDVGELFIVMRKVANTHVSRLEEVEKLMAKHPKLIVFYNFDYELEMLRGLNLHTPLAESRHLVSVGNVGHSGDGRDEVVDCSRCGNVGQCRDAPIVMAEWNGHKHQQIPDADRWVYLVQYTAGAEGWNCIETDAVCMYSQTYSYKQHEQVQGRIDRLNTPFIDLWYYLLKSNAMIDKAIGKALKNKHNFNESQYMSTSSDLPRIEVKEAA